MFPSADVNEPVTVSNVELLNSNSSMKSVEMMLREHPLSSKVWHCPLPSFNFIMIRIGSGDGFDGARAPTKMYVSSL